LKVWIVQLQYNYGEAIEVGYQELLLLYVRDVIWRKKREREKVRGKVGEDHIPPERE
jgi:hypothetical protein